MPTEAELREQEAKEFEQAGLVPPEFFPEPTPDVRPPEPSEGVEPPEPAPPEALKAKRAETTRIAQSRRIAQRLEKEKGIPAKITLDRLLDKPGWREREIAFLAKQTKTSQADVARIIEEGGGIGDKEENQGLEVARARLLTKSRLQTKTTVKPTEAPEIEVRQPGTRGIKVGTKTDTPGVVKDTAAIRKLAKDDPRLFKILIEKGVTAFNKAVDVESFVIKQDVKRFAKLNTKLPDGKFISNVDLNKAKSESPEIFNLLKTKGFAAANKRVDEINASVEKQNKQTEITSQVFEGKVPDGVSKAEAIKIVWRAITPWDETAGETYLQYMKRFPERLKDTFIANVTGGVIEGQGALKAEFDANKNAPLWAKVLFPQDVIFDDKSGKFLRLRLAVAPQLAKAPPKASVKVAVKERIDWNKITDAIRSGKVKSAEDAANWAKINKAVGAAREKLAKEAGIERTKKVIKALQEAAKRQASDKTSRAAQIAKQREFLQQFFRKNTTGNKNVGDINKAIADKLALIKSASSARVTAVPSLSLTLSQLKDLKQMADVKTVTKFAAETKRLEAVKGKTLSQQKLATELRVSEQLLNQVQEQVKEQTQTKTATALITATALALAQQTDTVTETQIKNLVKQQTENLTNTKQREQVNEQLKVAETQELKIKPLTRTQIGLDEIEPATRKPPPKTGEPERLRPRVGEPGEPVKPIKRKKLKKLRVKLGAPEIKEKAWTPKEIASAFGFKSGFAIHAIKSPYRRGIDERSFHIDDAPAGLQIIPLYKGRGSLRSSARVISGRLKRKVTTDVGNQDIISTPHNGGRRVSIHSVRDTTGTVSRTTIKRGKSISKKKGRIFRSNVGGSEVLSRRPLRSI